MALSETIYFIITFSLAVIFTVFGIVLDVDKILMKIIAGFIWVILAIIVFILDSPPNILTIFFSTLCWGFGFIMWASTTKDWFNQRKDKWSEGL